MGYRFRPEIVTDNLDFLLQGALVSLWLSLAAVAIGLVIAVVVAILRGSRYAPLRALTIVYIESFRAIPLIVQLYFIFFGLPSLGVRLNSLQAGFIALCLYSGAYCSEIVRAGLESVPRGQRMAAQMLGFTRWQVLRHVILPQALGKIMPPLGNQFIDTTLSSSVLAVIGVEELTMHGTLLDSRTFRPFEVYAAVGIIYFLLTIILTGVFSLVGRWIQRGSRRPHWIRKMPPAKTPAALEKA